MHRTFIVMVSIIFLRVTIIVQYKVLYAIDQLLNGDKIHNKYVKNVLFS